LTWTWRLLEQGTHCRRRGRLPENQGKPSPIVTISTTNLIRLQSDFKEHVKGEYEFRNTRNGTRIIKKEMADYSVMNAYLDKNNLHYFTFSPKAKKPIKAVILHLPPDKPAEDISNSLEDLGFKVINARQMTATRRTPNGQNHVELLPLFLVTLKKHKISRYIQVEWP
jgi:hypothetical protein